MGKKKRGIYIGLFVLFLMLLTSIVSAGFFDWFKKTITGRPTQSVSLNVTVGVPQIITVYNSSAVVGGGLNLGAILFLFLSVFVLNRIINEISEKTRK